MDEDRPVGSEDGRVLVAEDGKAETNGGWGALIGERLGAETCRGVYGR
jgi:hypothetical protein